MNEELKRQLDIIRRGAIEIISEAELTEKLKLSIEKKKPLTIKAGFDPTAPDIHLGHTVLLRKLRHFQELGHKVVFLIGDYTALIGDPSGQSQVRKIMTIEEVDENAKTYLKQVSKILLQDKGVFELRRNSEWFRAMPLHQFLSIASKQTLSRIIERDDFSNRIKEGKPVSMLEALYPIMQGYDSVELKADIELGGVDQKFNLLVGREIQRQYPACAQVGQVVPQVVITMPLLVGTDGVQKMSKSYGNYIGINDPPKDIYGKLMSISDELMYKYYELLTDEDLAEVKKLHPMDAKKKLASLIVGQYYGLSQAEAEKKNFEDVFQKRENPTDAPKTKLPPATYTLNQVFDRARPEFKNIGIGSRSELVRKLEEGAIKIDGTKITDGNFPYFAPHRCYLLKIGRHFLNIDTT